MTKYRLEFSKKVMVNTDPQRRCYNGCNFSEEEQDTPWREIMTYSDRAEAEDSVKVFGEINPKSQYRIIPVEAGE